MDTKHNESTLRQLRQDIDTLVQRLEAEFSGSRELSLVKTKLEEAKMWAGKELGNIGVELPPQYADRSTAVSQATQGQDQANDEPQPGDVVQPNPTDVPPVNPDEINGHVNGGVDQ